MVWVEVRLLPPCEGVWGVGGTQGVQPWGGNKIWCKPKVVSIKGYYLGEYGEELLPTKGRPPPDSGGMSGARGHHFGMSNSIFFEKFKVRGVKGGGEGGRLH